MIFFLPTDLQREISPYLLLYEILKVLRTQKNKNVEIWIAPFFRFTYPGITSLTPTLKKWNQLSLALSYGNQVFGKGHHFCLWTGLSIPVYRRDHWWWKWLTYLMDHRDHISFSIFGHGEFHGRLQNVTLSLVDRKTTKTHFNFRYRYAEKETLIIDNVIVPEKIWFQEAEASLGLRYLEAMVPPHVDYGRYLSIYIFLPPRVNRVNRDLGIQRLIFPTMSVNVENARISKNVKFFILSENLHTNILQEVNIPEKSFLSSFLPMPSQKF
jgi:hypothetical protein